MIHCGRREPIPFVSVYLIASTVEKEKKKDLKVVFGVSLSVFSCSLLQVMTDVAKVVCFFKVSEHSIKALCSAAL